jgi:hypothetical protein
MAIDLFAVPVGCLPASIRLYAHGVPRVAPTRRMAWPNRRDAEVKREGGTVETQRRKDAEVTQRFYWDIVLGLDEISHEGNEWGTASG